MPGSADLGTRTTQQAAWCRWACAGACCLALLPGLLAEDLPLAETVSLEPEPGGVPQAIAALDGEAGLGLWVALQGAGTKDPEGTPQAYEWRQTEGPALGLNAEESAACRVWRLLLRSGAYRFEFRARNGKGWSACSPLSFTVADGPAALPPEEALRVAGAGERMTLPGEGWKQLCGPGVEALYQKESHATSFWTVRAGLYLFEALRAGRTPERRAVRVPPGADPLLGDRRPYAELPRPMDGLAGEPLELDGSNSKDPDGDTLQARWICDDRSGGLELTAQGLKATFKSTREGIFRVRLIVSDGKLESAPAETFLRILRGVDDPAKTLQPEDLPPDADPLSQPVTLRLYESDLDRAVQRFPTDCKVALRIAPELCPPENLKNVRLDVGVAKGPVRLLVDWIARQTGSAYRRDASGSLWLTTPLAWVKEEKIHNAVLAADALHVAKDGADLMAILKQAFRGVLAARADTSLTFQPEDQKVVAFMPESACKRLAEILVYLRAPKAGLGLPAPAAPGAGDFFLRRTLGEKKVSLHWQGRRLDLALRELAESSGLAAGFDAREFPASRGLPRLHLRLDEVVLREAVREIVAAAGFDGCQPHGNSGLWFYRGPEPYPSGELLWDLAYATAYDLEPVLAAAPLLSGEVIAHQVRQRVFPGSWKDPAACCAYHVLTRKLLVVHGEAAHARVLIFLHDLRERGEDALGPVETEGPGLK